MLPEKNMASILYFYTELFGVRELPVLPSPIHINLRMDEIIKYVKGRWRNMFLPSESSTILKLMGLFCCPLASDLCESRLPGMGEQQAGSLFQACMQPE